MCVYFCKPAFGLSKQEPGSAKEVRSILQRSPQKGKYLPKDTQSRFFGTTKRTPLLLPTSCVERSYCITSSGVSLTSSEGMSRIPSFGRISVP